MRRNKVVSMDAQPSSAPGGQLTGEQSRKALAAAREENNLPLHEVLWRLENTIEEDGSEVHNEEFEEVDGLLYDYEMNLSEKIRLFIMNDLGGAEEKARILAPQWAKALNASTLPERAPSLYAQREVRPELGRKENPIEFLQRVWGDYMRAGILYQDDIKRLGDEKLVQAVRGRCRDDGIDPATILPPPRSAKVDMLLSQDVPAAVRNMATRQLKERDRSQRYRARQQGC